MQATQLTKLWVNLNVGCRLPQQSLIPEESSPATDETTKKKKKLSFWKPGSTSATSDTKLDGEEKAPLKNASGLGLPWTESREEVAASQSV